MGDDRALYNANDGLTGRGGGPYLDQEEDILAEERRARIEGRKPDLKNPPASAGTVLVTAGQLLANAGVNNLPSVQNATAGGEEAAVKALADSDDTALKARGKVPTGAFEPLGDSVDLSMRSALMTDGSAPEGEKNDEPFDDEGDDSKDKPKEPSTTKPGANASDNAGTSKSSDPAGTKPTAK